MATVEHETIDAYAAMAQGEALKPYSYTPEELGPLDVEIDVTHCGICHSTSSTTTWASPLTRLCRGTKSSASSAGRAAPSTGR